MEIADHPFRITIPFSDLDCKNQNMISPAKEELVNFTNKLNNTVFMGGLTFALCSFSKKSTIPPKQAIIKTVKYVITTPQSKLNSIIKTFPI